ncbi:hypothetical protein [Methylophaga sp.]|uniref:hypothetical protein n=1 Tax=Methylophaga sp. TaxID=2024840 RepID=UPI003F69E7CB
MRGILKNSATIAVIMVLSLGLTACGNSPKQEGPVIASEGKKVFETGLQYVQIEDRQSAGASNDHPVSISSENMRTLLESLYITDTVLFKERQSPLFSDYELQVLSSALPSGLARAESSEDVTFVTIGTHKSTLAAERETNTGRVFFSGGRLNIIMGKVREVYREKDPITNQPIDRRTNPLSPGTRASDSEPERSIVLDTGISFYVDPKTGEERTDWIVMDIPTVLATMAEREAEVGEGFLSPEQKEAIARNTQETNNLRDDMANIKEVLFEMSDKLDKLQNQIDELKAE